MMPWQRQWEGWRHLGFPHISSGSRACLCVSVITRRVVGQVSTIVQDQPGCPEEAGWVPAPRSPPPQSGPVAPIWGQTTSSGAAQSAEKVRLMLSRKRPGLARLPPLPIHEAVAEQALGTWQIQYASCVHNQLSIWASVSSSTTEAMHTFIFSSWGIYRVSDMQYASKRQRTQNLGLGEHPARPPCAPCGSKAGGKLLCLGCGCRSGFPLRPPVTDAQQRAAESGIPARGSRDLGSQRRWRPGDFQPHCCQEKVSQGPPAHRHSLGPGARGGRTSSLSCPGRSRPGAALGLGRGGAGARWE